MNDEPDVNLTPLIDVVFVVLIVFILIAPVLDVERVALAEAKPIKDEQVLQLKEKSPISIVVRKDNTILLDGMPVKLENLSAYLKSLKSEYPNDRPQLFHDTEAHFGTFQAIKNAAQAAGFDELDLILKPQ
ncbi:MAG: biopolymer transporter ExbD [Chlamydiia bacterium]|nr:biopolymer transporter ExbD [Chlamydiia bacterium]